MAFSMGGSNGGRRIGGRRSSMGTMAEINIVPLVDVVLVLLIIFMLTAHVMEFGLEIKVPEVKETSNTVKEQPIVSITSDSRIFLNDKPANINRLGADIAARFKGAKGVYVMADRATTYDPIAQVIAELGAAKYDIQLVTKPIDNTKRQ